MARKYSRGAAKDVEREMRKFKRGTLKSGKRGKGGTVKSRKQAIAIALSEARREGKRVPPRAVGRPSKGARSHAAKKKPRAREPAAPDKIGPEGEAISHAQTPCSRDRPIRTRYRAACSQSFFNVRAT
jgi:Family of unknown function (DUF6496)